MDAILFQNQTFLSRNLYFRCPEIHSKLLSIRFENLNRGEIKMCESILGSVLQEILGSEYQKKDPKSGDKSQGLVKGYG